MTLKLFKNLTIAIALLSLVAACTDLTSDPNHVAPPKFGKARYGAGKYPRRGSDLAASTLVGNSSSSFFAFASFTSGNLWDRLRANSNLPDYESQPQVQAQINWFIKNQGYLSRTVNRAAPYMYYIFEQVRQRNLPSELVLLPVIESAYNPFVRSSAGASGLWQLMPGTARGFGVRQNFWFDGRRDIYASTNAALDYLTYLHSYFSGDWLLAIAAYDTGEGNVQNAIRRNAMHNRGTTFWTLPLAAETRSYVPRLLALAAIIKNPSKYGIVLPTISDKPYFEQVDVGAPIKLNQAAQLADMSLNELKQLNPGYNRNITDPTGHHKLILPLDKIALFKERLINLQAAKETQLVKAEDDNNLGLIANAQADEHANTEESKAMANVIKRIHMVKKGETFSTIARRYKVSVNELKDWNDTKARKALKPGSKLVVFIEKATDSSATPTVKTKNHKLVNTAAKVNSKIKSSATSNVDSYTVHPGDNLAKVAKKFGLKPAELKRLNHLKTDALKPGQHLMLRN